MGYGAFSYIAFKMRHPKANEWAWVHYIPEILTWKRIPELQVK